VLTDAHAETTSMCPDEQEIASFVEGRLSEPARRALEQHLDACEPCMALVAELADVDPLGDTRMIESGGRSPSTPGLADADALGDTRVAERVGGSALLLPGTRLGRYVIEELVGRGGMGVVYVGHDPELGRKVALKLVLPSELADGAARREAHARLLREAQALAKLDHPNVVAVYDVGSLGGQVFIAMPFVEGGTLAAWLRGGPRPWAEVLTRMRGAGQGLAAAHRAGLVHRDFKPANVLLTPDGAAQVVDFGLVRPDRSGSLHDEPITGRFAAELDTVTRTGVVMGTPAYMAPEQFRGEVADARADQFSFCVALWEALYGERPFAGHTSAELSANVRGGRLRAPAKGRDVPSWLRGVCERGLSVDPQERWPAMEALLQALAQGRVRARVRKGLAAVGVLAVLGVGEEGWRRYDVAQRIAACEASGAEIEGAWSPARRQRMHDALMATGVSYAASTADAAMPWLERQAAEWREARVEACLDAEVRRQWDAETLDRSLWCLDERRMQLESLVDELTVADAHVVQKVVLAAAGLGSVAACRDEKVLEALVPPPAQVREAVQALRADVTRAGNLERTGRYDQGLALARSTLAQAETLAWPPLTAAARYRLGSLLQEAGAHAEAEAMLQDAYFEATEGVATEVAFEAAMALVRVVGPDSTRLVDARRWTRHAEAALTSIHDDEGLRRAGLLDYLADACAYAGAHDEAKALHEQALPVYERVLGPDHPDVATSLNSLAVVYARIGAHEEAKALFERALAIYERTLGSDHPHVAGTLANLAIVHLNLGARDEAMRASERSLAIFEAALGPDHSKVATILNTLGVLHEAAGAYEEAEAFDERALAIWERTLGPDDPQAASSLVNLASVHHRMGDYEEANARFQRALTIFETALGPDHPNVSYPLLGQARAALAQGRPSDAIPLAQRALAVREQSGLAAHEQAVARFMLARALWDAPEGAGRDRTRAMSLAEQARDGHRGAGAADELAAAQAWIAEHGGAQ
jgi:tetratricopeptide (TPR) repeat protein